MQRIRELVARINAGTFTGAMVNGILVGIVIWWSRPWLLDQTIIIRMTIAAFATVLAVAIGSAVGILIENRKQNVNDS